MESTTIASSAGIQALAKIVEEARKTRGSSYRDFGLLTGISHATLRRLELGQIASPEVQTLQKLAPYTDYNASELVAIVGGRPVESVRDVLTVSDIWPAVERLPRAEQLKMLHRLIDLLCGENRPLTRPEFQQRIQREEEALATTTKIPPDRLREIARGESPKLSEVLKIAEAFRLNKDVVSQLYPEISPATKKSAGSPVSAHHATVRPVSPPGGKG
jgi:transcriptional regulator with XRE-family HTH domain